MMKFYYCQVKWLYQAPNRTGKHCYARSVILLLAFCLLQNMVFGQQGTPTASTSNEVSERMLNSTYVPSTIVAKKWEELDKKIKKSETSFKKMASTRDTVLNLGSLKKKALPVTVFGYFRFFGYGRNMTEPYPNLAPFEKAYSVGDGYREPTMSLNIIGRPNGRSSFGTELFFLHPYEGKLPEDNVFLTNLGLNFYGNFRTEIGTFGVRAGGIHWYNLSPFTVGVYQVLDRFSIFDRTPWEGVSNTTKYDNYYASGSVNVGDLRWNFAPFQGLILNGNKLPWGLNFDLFWGKTQPNGGLVNAQDDPFATIVNPNQAGNVPTYIGFAGNSRVIPSLIGGGKIGKTWGKNNVSYNFIDSRTALDSINVTETWRRYQVHTASFNLDIKGINVSGEMGGGFFEAPGYDLKWGEALMLRVKVPDDILPIPFDIQLYQISKDFYNENGEILTNGNAAIQNQLLSQVIAGQTSVGGLITQVNQLAHNRRGINLNTGITAGSFKFNLGWGLAKELDPQIGSVSYIHRINGLALSRIYNPFPANATSATVFGPYQRKFSFFRGVSEVVRLTDLDPATAAPINDRYYNVVDLQSKFKTELNKKPLYVFYLASFGSASMGSSIIPTLNEDSYLFVQYHEVDVYYEILDRFILTGYFGLEEAQGGTFTQWDVESQLPLNQLGTGIGVGFDWSISDFTGLYFRYRWMDFEDRSFSLDRFKGREATIELKTFF